MTACTRETERRTYIVRLILEFNRYPEWWRWVLEQRIKHWASLLAKPCVEKAAYHQTNQSALTVLL